MNIFTDYFSLSFFFFSFYIKSKATHCGPVVFLLKLTSSQVCFRINIFKDNNENLRFLAIHPQCVKIDINVKIKIKKNQINEGGFLS